MKSLIGQTLGQYRIIEQIGQGGMATVYKAYQPSLDRYVAIKILPPHFAHEPGFAERFTREARAVARLNHPNILPIIDFGQEDDLSYIVMKYASAGTLKSKMGYPMAMEEATRLIEGIAAALDHAHERGILHRDVKPSNVLLDEGDWVLLTDFGLAKMVTSDEGLTGSGVGVGTPAYTSPEQGQGKTVDARTDIYSLGVVLYEMVTGQVPFQAETPFAIVMKHITDPLPLPSSLRPGLPEAVERVILKSLSKAPEDRYETAGDLLRALHSAVTGLMSVEPAITVETPAEMPIHLPDLYTRALGHFYTEQWAKAIEVLEPIVAAQPDYENGDAARRLEQAREQLKLVDLYAQTQGALSDENWARAVTCLNEITALDAGYRDAETLLKQARRQNELADLYGDARRLHDSEQWQAVISVWERIHALAPDYPDPDGLLASACAEQEALRRAEEHTRHLADLYRRGLTHVADDEWEEAAALFKEIESLEPGYQEAAGLLARARREIQQAEPETEPPAPVEAAPPPAPPPAPASLPVAEAPVRKWIPWKVIIPTVGVVLLAISIVFVMSNLRGKEGKTRVWDKDGSVMVYVPAGWFWMGSDDSDSDASDDEKPQHKAYLDAFWIDRTEVTNARYRQCVDAGVCTPPSKSRSYAYESYYGNSELDVYPVIYVDWHQAGEYCRWADKRLPTEAEWEKAARGTDRRTYPWGESIECNHANYWGKDGGCIGDTTVVGNYPPGASPYGALDMAGNVWEWVADWYGSDYYASSPSRNPQGPGSSDYRVVRGGSWDYTPDLARCTVRRRNYSVDSLGNVGFRCVSSIPGSSP